MSSIPNSSVTPIIPVQQYNDCCYCCCCCCADQDKVFIVCIIPQQYVRMIGIKCTRRRGDSTAVRVEEFWPSMSLSHHHRTPGIRTRIISSASHATCDLRLKKMRRAEHSEKQAATFSRYLVELWTSSEPYQVYTRTWSGNGNNE